jgi:hypothetical protein
MLSVHGLPRVSVSVYGFTRVSAESLVGHRSPIRNARTVRPVMSLYGR